MLYHCAKCQSIKKEKERAIKYLDGPSIWAILSSLRVPFKYLDGPCICIWAFKWDPYLP